MINQKWEAAKAWRQGLLPGNGVAICNNGNHRDRYAIGTVQRVTATQLIVENEVGYAMRFNRESGRMVGTGRASIEEITPQIRASIKEARDRAEFGNLCYRPENLPADEIAVMLEALKTHRAFKETHKVSTDTDGKFRWDFTSCTRCALVQPKGHDCRQCGNPGKPRKQVKAAGMAFIIHGFQERSAAVGGRFFHAIGRNITGWTLFEHNVDIAIVGHVSIIGRKFERLLDTKALVTEINRLVATGEKLPTDLRPPFEIDEARHRDNQITLASLRMKAEK